MAHGHGEGIGNEARRAGARHQGRLRWAFVLTLGFLLVEFVAGLLTNSLALISDAGHMLTDVAGLGMALAAISLASRGRSDPRRTFGLYRVEIVAALANALLLFGVAGYVLYEAMGRLREPQVVLAVPMLIVAVTGLGVNILAFLLLREGAKESLNVQAAYLEVLGDALGSIGVILAAAVVHFTGWTRADAVVGAAIGLFILPRTWRLGSQALRILIQAAPPDVNVDAIRADLMSVPGVIDVHDLHVWTLTSEMEVASAHLRVRDDVHTGSVLTAAAQLLRERHRVGHATLQVEPAGHEGCDELTW
jgi:cobalt-zinc-cadmium efflux system protein